MPAHRLIPEYLPNPSGLCMCGCGQATNRATTTCSTKNRYKGEHLEYFSRHQLRLKEKPVSERYDIDPVTGCWIWNGPINPMWGYGQGYYKGKKYRAHRLTYELRHGPVPDGKELDHLCRNRKCVNPDHMEPVTHAVNMRRGAVTKLTEAQVVEIVSLRGTKSQGEIAAMFGIHSTTVCKIQRGRAWPGVAFQLPLIEEES